MADDEQTSPEPVAASGRSVELTLVERIVTAVSMALRSDPAPYPGPDSTDGRALPPLTDTVDAEALETVVSDLDDGEIRLRYAGCRVTIGSSGCVRANPNAGTGTPSWRQSPEPATETTRTVVAARAVPVGERPRPSASFPSRAQETVATTASPYPRSG
jgi:hypothetical protein